ncbi:AraC family transcriptional regulator [Paraflavitalea sp. CAU 1676]|uniref:helix-turn-helix transcriptional regulator n=1 Tax=Paraflavitalea sp. CAU 1676 TaxID=3032598 RepID=UPI0023DAF54F|nr:AraC family transcriptional regulator [Paraflavitalea sp. CAU 1676]MDF2192794.1 AraC family transcriptional regulator [Paraflavitalea sp. CAU 1676]
MKCSGTGQFYGTTNERVDLQGITLTDTEYTAERVPWHFHENNYFTFILEGGMTEVNKQRVYECAAGDLLFHNWQDAHYNIASRHYTRGFHVEISNQWLAHFEPAQTIAEGSLCITDPLIKKRMYQLVREMKLEGRAGGVVVDALMLEVFSLLGKSSAIEKDRKPKWVVQLEAMLRESREDWSLTALAQAVNVHPVHLSRHFSKYFGMTLGDYLRTVKLQRAITLLPREDLSLTDISLECGFADQSHFIRSFKAHYAVTPLHYRRFLR